jgi:hypothetical protein
MPPIHGDGDFLLYGATRISASNTAYYIIHHVAVFKLTKYHIYSKYHRIYTCNVTRCNVVHIYANT